MQDDSGKGSVRKSNQTGKGSGRTGDLEGEVKIIKDSRGRPTVSVKLLLGETVGIGDVPAGASTGADEAHTVPTEEAVANANDILIPMLKAANIDIRRHQAVRELEKKMVERAGDNCGELGANAVVPVSRALWQLAAAYQGMTLAKYIARNEPELASDERVHFYMNIFNGGLHALKEDDGEKLNEDRIAIQEIMIVPLDVSNYREALQVGERIDASLKDILQRTYGNENVTRADEAGFSVKGLGDSNRAIAHVLEAAERSGYQPGDQVKLALDVAASSFYDRDTGTYAYQGRQLTSDEMVDEMLNLVDSHGGKILSIEDPLDEDDWDAWERLSLEMAKRDVISIGDDLFVTQTRRLRRGINNRSAHAILIKVNQNGSIGGTLDVMRYARENGMRCVISHRSGETLDDSIADLAFATGALGLKTGDPQPVGDFPDPQSWVRRRKYLRMVQLEEGKR